MDQSIAYGVDMSRKIDEVISRESSDAGERAEDVELR